MNKKYKEIILIFVITFFSIISVSLDVCLSWGDELWNFQSIYKMYLGNQIYTDINIIQTPLFFYIGQIIFSIFGANLFIFRIYHALILAFLMISTYLLLKELKIRKSYLKLFYIIILGFIIVAFAPVQANYNLLALAMYVFGTWLSIKFKNDTKKYYMIQGIVAFLVFAIKQNMGVFYTIGMILSTILINIKSKNKIKNIAIFVVTFSACLILCATILFINGNLYKAIDYCFLGMTEFGTKNIGFSLGDAIIAIFITCISILTSIFLLKNEKIQEILTLQEKENIKKMIAFSLFLLPNIYPIFNRVHRNIAIYLLVVNITYILYLIFKNFDFGKKTKKICKTILLISILLVAIWEIYLIGYWIKNILLNNQYIYQYCDPFFGVEVEEETTKNIDSVTKFIKESNKDVIIISPKSTLYNIPLNKNNGIYDLVLKGNLGINGETKLIENIQKKENTIFLIEKENVIYQESDKIKEYIKNNLIKKGKIEEFDIYETIK